jgi:DNA repair protein RecO (recombination protein O)
MASRNMTAIVLRVSDLGESDKIVTFYGRETGKIAGIAKGAKRSKKRFCNKLEIFSLLDVLYVEGRSSLVRISEAELLASFMSLRQDYGRYVSAALACELLYYWSRDYDADRDVFALLLWTLESIDKGLPPLLVQIFFQVKLYTLLGYQLHLGDCSRCAADGPPGKPYVFHPGRHGLLCNKCSPSLPAREMIPLSLNTIKLLRSAQDLPLEKLNRLRFSDTSIREALQLFKGYGQYLLQREIAAWDFLGKKKKNLVNPGR